MAEVLKRFAIALDVKRTGSSGNVEVVEGDNGNVLEVTLTDGGTPVDLTDCRVVAVFSHSGGTVQQDTDNHGITVDETITNKLYIELYTGSIKAPVVNCELQIYSGTELATLITTAWFNFQCRQGFMTENVLNSTDEWPLLVDALARTEAVETAEALRVTAEGSRVTAESERDTAEGLRNTAEGLRATAETARNTAETGRDTAEGLRDAAEGLRASAEISRETAETARDTAEGLRDTAEGLRETAETSRASAESSRASAESARVTAENARVSRDTAFGVFEDYNPATAYVPLNKVAYNGSTYQCVLASTGNLPTNTTYWKPVALKGADGEGAGDMLASTYDPTNKAADAFLLSNMDGDADHRTVTDTEKATWNGKASAADVDALEAAEAVILLSGTGPAFTTSEPLPASGLKRTLKFPAAATSATVQFATGGAINVYAYGTTAFKPKANQVVGVVYDGTNFTVCSSGGGIELPAAIAAGATTIYQKSDAVTQAGASYANIGTGWGFTAVKGGTYRIKYDVISASSSTYSQLTKNGSAIAGSEITRSGYGTLTGTRDIALNASDTVRLQYKNGFVSFFIVSMLAADLQTEIDSILTAL